MPKKPMPIGIEDFGELIRDNYYYIDKTLLIKELLDKKGKVNLFTRPRRFGKTLNMSMLRYFFEDTDNPETSKENRALFQGLKIMDCGREYLSHMGQYPVIQLSLKSVKQPTWDLSFLMLKRQLAVEFDRHGYVRNALDAHSRSRFQVIQEEKGSLGDYVDAIAFLSKCLEKYHQAPVIILIDEYDVPLENAYFCGFYQQMVDFVRSIFESALKTNPSLYFSVITGCLRITKESIFTGLNNLNIISILNEEYGEYFGFLSGEVREMLAHYHRTEAFPTVCEWYDGYCFGNKEVFNPWSVINFVKSLAINGQALPSLYWSNTSSNNIVRTLVEKSDLSTRAEIEDLICGETIEKPVHEDITYEDIDTSMDNLWNFLFFTGYLKKISQRMLDDEQFVTLSIPNKEVRQIYKTKITGWFREKIGAADLSGLYRSILEGNEEEFQESLTGLLQDAISFYDNAEAFYHGFLLGILGGLRRHIIKSNRESGDGRYDILIQSPDVREPVILLELKLAQAYTELDLKAKQALLQIDKRAYDREFVKEGYRKSIRYGIAFYKKGCRVKKEEIFLE